MLGLGWLKRILSLGSSVKASSPDEVESESPPEAPAVSVTADNPISSPDADALNRTKMASAFAEQIQNMDARHGLVVGVLGPWGSGKTSFVNLTRHHLVGSGIPVLDFNPWMFSGADQLVQSFFIELTAQLKLRPDLKEIGEKIEEYGEAFSGLGWLPFVGTWIEGGHKAVVAASKLLQSRKEGAGSRHAKVTKALSNIPKPIVVVLDDIDRLTTTEIRDVFKLVRLTANFPNIIYLLAFDRARVEQALGEHGIPGRDYLEKILQIGIDLPAVPFEVLNSQIFAGIEGALSGIENKGAFDETLWPDVFMEVIRPLIRNMRDVRRYGAAIHGTVKELGGGVALVDCLALEAVRIFLPDVFTKLHQSIAGLTTTSKHTYGEREPEYLKEQIVALIGSAGEQQNVIRNLIIRLFPAAQRHIGNTHFGAEWKNGWLKERKVAHEDILRFYLERVAGEKLQAYTCAEVAWSILADQNSFDAYMRSLPPNQLRDVISMLEVYEESYTQEHAVSGSIVLLNLQQIIPNVQLSFYDFGPQMTVTRVVYRLLKALNEPSQIEAAAQQILSQLQQLSYKLALINIIGYREKVGHQLISEDAARRFEREWRAEVHAASAERLSQETDLLTTLLTVIGESSADEPKLSVPDEPTITLSLLKSAKSETRSQPMGSRAVTRTPRLYWDGLVKVFGDEAVLHERVASLMQSSVDIDQDLRDLVEKYLSGWRPKEFLDSDG